MTNTIKFSIANKAVNHLGRKLYNSNPPAIAELIANSYDAYATQVNILLHKTFLVVADNGKGLNVDELQKKYAKIGRNKDKENPINNLEERLPMGQKGIGKLAAFSLGDMYTVYTKSINSDKWITFTLKYEELLSEENTHNVVYQEIENLPTEFSQYNSNQSGMIVKIEHLRRRVITSTTDNLKIHLSRRFYIASNKDNFKVKINDDEVSLESHIYYDSIELLVYFGYSTEEINELFPNIDASKKILYNREQDVIKYFNENKIKGWMGGVAELKKIQTKNFDFNNVIVFINKKIADENIFKESANARIASQYLVGEVHADFFYSENDSPITSSRQGLDISDEYVSEFIDNLKDVRNVFVNKWQEIRTKDSISYIPEDIKNNESYQNWLKSLDNRRLNIHKKFLHIMIQGIDEQDKEDEEIYHKNIKQMISSIVHTINNVDIQELENSLNRNNNSFTELLNTLMSKIANSDHLKVYEIAKNRILAIKKLQELMNENNTPEKFFEDHLYEHPWLINPYWNKKLNNQESFNIARQKYYREINKEGEIHRNFIDILISIAEEQYPIIVELKKNTATGYAKVKYTDIYNQIEKYRIALIQNLSDNMKSINKEDIKAYFIISEDAGIEGSGNSIEISEKEIISLEETFNIKILKYNQIIDNALCIYEEFIKIIESEKNIPCFN
ncbi:ATP-binding protein [Campylobacter upsaliensis]